MVPPMPPNSPEPPDAAGFLHHDASGEAPNSSNAPEDDVNRLETLQSSLVERIAAVDDERRRTAMQMRRAIETNRDEILEQGRRQRVLLVLVGSLIILLTAGAVGYLQYQLGAMSSILTDAIARLEGRVNALEARPASTGKPVSASDGSNGSAFDGRPDGMGAQLSALREQVASLTNEIAALKAGTESPGTAVSVTGVAGDAGVVERPQRADAVVDESGGVPTASAADRRSANEGEPARAQQQARGTARAAGAERARPTPEAAADGGGSDSDSDSDSDSVSVSVSVSETVATPDAIPTASVNGSSADGPVDTETDSQNLVAFGTVAMLDSMIDRRWREVEQEYQRLALEVSSPAVRSRKVAEESDDDATADSPSPKPDTESVDEVSGEATQAASPVAAERRIQGRLRVDERPFVLQLIGVYDRSRLDDFVARHPLPEQVYIREERFRGRPWFVLFHSLHPDQASARNAMQALPPELTDLEPWIRELPEGVELEVIQRQGAQP